MKRYDCKKGYSLIEVLITLVILVIVMVALTNLIFLTIDISRKSLARSLMREEQNDILNKLQKDIRNSRFVQNCVDSTCEVALDKVYTWTTCQNEESYSVCKKYLDGENEIIIEQTDPRLNVVSFSIEPFFFEAEGQQTLIVTLVADFESGDLEIEPQIRQIVISTRNYTL